MKLAIAANLLRLCDNRWYTIALWFIVGLTIAYELVAFLFFFVNCKPLAGNWDATIGAKCADTHTIIVFGLLNTSCNIFTDVALAVIPIPIIWGLNMKKTTRLYLIGVLSLGYLYVSCSCWSVLILPHHCSFPVPCVVILTLTFAVPWLWMLSRPSTRRRTASQWTKSSKISFPPLFLPIMFVSVANWCEPPFLLQQHFQFGHLWNVSHYPVFFGLLQVPHQIFTNFCFLLVGKEKHLADI